MSERWMGCLVLLLTCVACSNSPQSKDVEETSEIELQAEVESDGDERDGESPSDESDGDDQSDEGDGEAVDCPAIAPALTSDRLFTKACSPYLVESAVTIGGGAVITVEPGVEFRFAAGSSVSVGYDGPAQIIAVGTAAEPIVFTSAAPVPAKGDWHGLFFGESTGAGTVLAHVRVRYAGQPSMDENGCVSIGLDAPGRLAITDSEFQACQGAGIYGWAASNAFAFEAFAGNRFVDCDAGLYVNANVIGSIQGAQSYDGTPRNRVATATFTTLRSATWLSQSGPWDFDDILDIAAASGGDAPMLTLAAGNWLRFPLDGYLAIGWTAGGLQALGSAEAPIVFESSLPSPMPGSWGGIGIFENTLPSSRIDHAIVRHAGQAIINGMYKGGMSCFNAPTLAMPVTNTLFEANARADASVCDCQSLIASDNSYTSPGGLILNDCP